MTALLVVLAVCGPIAGVAAWMLRSLRRIQDIEFSADTTPADTSGGP